MKIAFICSHTEDDYQSAVLFGAAQAAQELGFEFCAIQVGVISPAEEDLWPGLDAGGLIAAMGADAVLVLDGAIRHRASGKRFAAWLKGLGTLPMVLLNSDLNGFNVVNVENRRAFHELLFHLQTVHGGTRWLFVAGPLSNVDAAERLRAFREFELEQGRAPADLIQGDFLFNLAAENLSRYLEDHPVPDQVICANDAMAFGVIDVLRVAGIAVPLDCGVTGFDDVPFAESEVPPLTTVHLSIAELGRAAMLRLARILAAEPQVEPTSGVDTRLVLRQSCGCHYVNDPSAADELRNIYRDKERRQGFLLDLVYSLGLVMSQEELSKVLVQAVNRLDVAEFRLFALPEDPAAVFPAELVEIQVFSRGNPLIAAQGLVAASVLRDLPGNSGGLDPVAYPRCIHGIISGGEVLGIAIFRAAAADRPHLEIFIQNLVGPLMRLRQQADQARHAAVLEAKVRQRTLMLQEASAEVLQISEAERRRIGSELHDDICQQLAATLMNIKVLQGHVAAGTLRSEELGSLRGQVDGTLQAIRAFSRGLFPAELETLGLVEALERFAERIQQQTGIAVLCRVSALAGFAADRPDIALNLFRILQEGMQNVIRHAHASSVVMLAHRMPRFLRVEMHDNGQGMDETKPEGLGMRSMRYRALQLAANLEIRSSPEGTGIIIDLPLPQAQE